MTVRPLESFDLGPVGLGLCQQCFALTRHGFGGVLPYYHGSLFIVKLLERRGCSDQRLGRPLFDELIDLLYAVSSTLNLLLLLLLV